MTTELENYKKVFARVFDLGQDVDIENLEYQGIDEWDSVGHMALIANLETEFSIELDVDDVIDFSSFKVGAALMGKYGIQLT